MDRLQARILRDIAAQDQQRAAQRDGHRCDYDRDCEEWIELPLDSTHCCARPAKLLINHNYVKPDPEPGCAGAVVGLVLVAWLGTWLFSMWLAGGAF